MPWSRKRVNLASITGVPVLLWAISGHSHRKTSYPLYSPKADAQRPATLERYGPLLPCLSVVAHANASTPSRTPADLAFGGSSHADTTNSCPARSACGGYLRDHAVRLVNRRNRHCLC